ncbi:MAG: tetratricopeptide repeat protein [Ignavibacteriales bacterium]
MKSFAILLLLFTTAFSQTDERKLLSLFYTRNYEALISETAEILKNNSEDPVANSFRGQTLVKLGRFGEAKRFLETALENQKNNLAARAYIMLNLGWIYYIEKETNKAAGILYSCSKLEVKAGAPRDAKRSLVLLGLDSLYHKWKLFETNDIIFHFPPDSKVSDKEAFARSRQIAYEKISNFFNADLKRKINFYAWNKSTDAENIGLRPLGFSEPEFFITHSAINQTRGHEIAHIVIRNYVKTETVNKFIDEGAAMYFDMTGRNRLQAARDIIKEMGYKSKISISGIWQKPADYPDLIIYYLGAALVERLVNEESKEKLTQLLKFQSYENAENIYGERLNTVIGNLENELSAQ